MPDVYKSTDTETPKGQSSSHSHEHGHESHQHSHAPEPTAKQVMAQNTQNSVDWWKDVIDKVLSDTNQVAGSQLMSSYCVLPQTKFVTQQDDEAIVLLLRAHPITNVPWILLVLLMLLAPSIFQAFGAFAGAPAGFLFIGKLIWYLVTLAFAFEKFLYWYYSVFLVTNERLVDIDFENLLWRVVTYANLNHIEEPAMVTGGFMRSLLQYGNVYVTTASEQPSVEALAVPWPQKVVDIISRLSEELEKRRERGE